MITPEHLKVTELGPREIASPIPLSSESGDGIGDYVDDGARVLAHIELRNGDEADGSLRFEKAGPRAKVYFRPQYSRAAIVTCGGLSPGLNNVIRSIHNELYYHYGLKDILGIRNGCAT